ncbi:MAG TPA: FliH/SctL family protein [Armatimonadota bacterium]
MSSVIKTRERRCDDRPDDPFVLATSDFGMAEPEPEADAEPIALGPSPEEIAAQTIAAAEERAQLTIVAAQREVARIEEDARRRGFEEGLKEAEARWLHQFHRLEEEAQRISQEHTEMMREAEPELARLSVEIARKVLKQELATNPEVVLTVVRAAMHRVKDKQVRISVNPNDLDVVRGARDSFASITGGSAEMDIVSDRRVGQGGCVVETPGGSLDARLETQLEHIGDLLEKACEEGHAPHTD